MNRKRPASDSATGITFKDQNDYCCEGPVAGALVVSGTDLKGAELVEAP